jgi:hypothetical protein
MAKAILIHRWTWAIHWKTVQKVMRDRPPEIDAWCAAQSLTYAGERETPSMFGTETLHIIADSLMEVNPDA